ncbi:LOG family protein [Marinimicrococcus flavescens]|uniref:Cytokinin riboside 5'-monophosphate phosphoribohydrolase n=1 Tax=Marinimicrococcus flavescens TaxID=3031815 RepID=A0AAP3XPG7_9PROT|nr:TIGR00730 family Rossman fold protein [Marinimicrococcus flavescens]
MTFSVCVFCGSRFGASPSFRAAAEALGREIGRRGWRLVYGGGDVGLMGVVASATLAAGGEVLGIIPRRLMEREVGKHDVTELLVTETMFARKERMIAESHAFLTLPGGLGTLDELLEVVTLRQLGYHDLPVLLVDVDGFWDEWQALLEKVVACGFADASAVRLLERAGGVAAAMELLENQAAPAS